MRLAFSWTTPWIAACASALLAGACSSSSDSSTNSGGAGGSTGGDFQGGSGGTMGGSAGAGGFSGGGGSGGTSAGVGGSSGRDASAGSDAGSAAGSPDGGAESAAGDQDGGLDGSGDAIVGTPIPAPVASGCITDVTPGVHNFDCDTTIDTISIPEQCTKTACGVIVDVHGGMMSSQMEDKNTNMRALGVQYGYIVVQPNALQNAVLLNQRLFVADTPMMPADDTRVMDILTQVIQVFHADTNRIHMTGFSEGGYMTWRWFCAHSDMLASIAAGAAAWQCADLANAGLTPPEVGCEMTGTSVPAHNLPMLYMQGTMDGLVDPMCADSWVRMNAMTALNVGPGTTIAGDPNFQTAKFVRTSYLDPAGIPFEYIQHQYTSDSAFLGVGIKGHCYPGSTDLTVTPTAQTVIQPDQLMAFGCKDQCDFNWGVEVIKFFMAHPKSP